MDTVMPYLDIALRSVISIAFLFFITRLMGRKQISQLTYFDYIIGISIGSICAEMATATDKDFFHPLLAMGIFAIIAITISIVTNKSIKLRRFFTGKTFLFIENGKIIEKNLGKAKFDVNDLLSAARNEGYFNISDIQFALLETNGKISFLPKAQKQPLTPYDMQLAVEQCGLTANVIIDGEVMHDNLKAIGLDEKWLRDTLKQQDAPIIEKIILATVDTNNSLTVFEKQEKSILKTCID